MGSRYAGVSTGEAGNETDRDSASELKNFSTRLQAHIRKEIKDAAFYLDKSQQQLIEEAWNLWKEAHPEWDEKSKL